MKVLITGGAGFIGSNLAQFHVSRGDQVVAVDDLSTGRLENLQEIEDEPNFRFVDADLCTWESLAGEVAAAERIYHMAAVVGMFRVLQNPTSVMRVNVCGTERLLELAAQCQSKAPIIIASSSSVYGHGNTSPELHEDMDLTYSPEEGGLNGYALSKLTNEIQGHAFHREHGLHVVIPRFFNVVGPHQTGTYGFVIPRFIQQAIAGKPLSVFGDGTQIRSFCDVRDTMRAVDQLTRIESKLHETACGDVVNVGNTREISILDLAKLIIERTGSSSGIQFLSFKEAYGEEFEQITQRRPNIDKLKQLTGFEPKWTLEQTIDDLLEHQLAQKTLS